VKQLENLYSRSVLYITSRHSRILLITFSPLSSLYSV